MRINTPSQSRENHGVEVRGREFTLWSLGLPIPKLLLIYKSKVKRKRKEEALKYFV